MNTGQKGKSLDRLDRDGVAQHRNVMHEIAMKKQISMYQREEKILERELREISKVKETLLQIRAPLRRRVQASAIEDNLEESSGTERSLRKTSVATRKTSVSTSSAQEKCTNEKDMAGACASKLQTFPGRPSLQVAAPSPNPRQRKISMQVRTHQNTPQGISALPQRKISAPTFGSKKNEVSEDCGKSGTFLPVIKTPNPPADCSPSIKRKSPLIDRPLSGEKNNESADSRNRPRSPALLTPIAPSRADTMRARSVPCDLPSHLAKTPRSRKPVDADECASLTMEETLRIKGKFRQIGHSVIATALLKGLKQKGQLSSEAIHNMHKPISLDEANEAKVEVNEETDVAAAELKDDEEDKVKPTGQGGKSFKNLARKTINVNRMIGTTGRRRAQSDPVPEKSGSVNKPSLRPKTSGLSIVRHSDKVLVQEKAETTSAQQRRKDSNETHKDFNTQGDESENSSQNQQMYKKHSTEVDPLRPLMNPRTAHARRRKVTVTGDARDYSEQADNMAKDTRPQSAQLDESTTANKSVRFASDAWT